MAGMQVLDYFKQEEARLHDAAKAIAEKAQSEARRMTTEEKKEIDSILKTAADYTNKIEGLEEDEKIHRAIDLVGSVKEKAVNVEKVEAHTLGEAVVQSEAMAGLKASGFKGRFNGLPLVEWKAATDAVLEGDWGTTGGPIPTRQLVPGIVGPVEGGLVLADLFGQGNASGPTVYYVKESATETGNDSDYVHTEGQPKHQIHFEFDTVSDTLRTLAAFLKVSSNALQDFAQLQSYLNTRLTTKVRQAEEAYLLDSLAQAANPSDASSIGGDNIFDAILAAITDVRVEGDAVPDGVVMSAQDFAEMSIQKASGGTGAYFSGGPYAPPASTPWGIRAVISNRLEPGTAYVGAFRTEATVWRMGGLSLDLSNSDEDDFQRNLVTIRAEERVLLTIYREEAFRSVDIGS